MGTSYRTQQGDFWDTIAWRLWGKEELMHELLRANPEHADVLVFPAGVVLTVPDVNTSTVPQDLPPWMV